MPPTGSYVLDHSTFYSGGTGLSNNFVLTGGDNVLDLTGFNAYSGPTISSFSGTLRGFSPGDELVFQRFGTAPPATTSYDGQTGILSVFFQGSTSAVLTIDIGTGYDSNSFYISGGVVTYGAPLSCYVSGTLIRTMSGEKAVETLSVGDKIVTASGEARRIVWLGHRSIDCAGHAEPETVWPYRVRAHAFGENQPARDLWLSPDHAVMVACLSQVLIPIKHLDNGATIAQVPIDSVSYWHVELESHDILLAENLPAESFLDTTGKSFLGRKGFEQDKAAFATRHGRPHLKSWQADACRPLVTEGAVIDAIRVQLLAQARRLGWRQTEDAGLDLRISSATGEILVARLSDSLFHLMMPAGTGDIVLSSRSFVPRHTDLATYDDRRLGVPLRRLLLRDVAANQERQVGLDDPALRGFHGAQEWQGERWRWTKGEGVISASLWAGARGMVTLEIELARDRGQMRAWIEPAELHEEADQAERMRAEAG